MNESIAIYAPYIAIPIISAFIGWITNLIAVKMIFRPYQPWKILGITFQGVIPRRQKELAERIGEAVEDNFVNHSDVAKVVQSPEVHDEITRTLESQLDRFVDERFATIPMIGSFLKGAMAGDMKKIFLAEIKESVPELLERLMNKVESQLSFRDIVREKVEEFDLRKLEAIIYKISSQELRAIEIWGGILGFLVGLFQILIIYFFD